MQEFDSTVFREAFEVAYSEFEEYEEFKLDLGVFDMYVGGNVIYVGNFPIFKVSLHNERMFTITYDSPIYANEMLGILTFHQLVTMRDSNYSNFKKILGEFFTKIAKFKLEMGGQVIYSCAQRVISIQEASKNRALTIFGLMNKNIYFNIVLEIPSLTLKLNIKPRNNYIVSHIFYLSKDRKEMPNGDEVNPENLREYSERTYWGESLNRR